jgi:DNA helicase-2/ATP-dependent DNA helicase PcrA
MEFTLPKLQTLTDEQELISENIPSKKISSILSARAGTGKTFILKVLAAKFPHLKILYVTFSKALADEARLSFMIDGKAPDNLEIKTAHALSYGSTKKFYHASGQLQLNDYYRSEALFEYLNEPEFDLDNVDDSDEVENIRQYRYEMRRTMLDLIQKCKVNMVDPDDEEAVDEVIRYYQIGAESVHRKHLKKSFQFSLKPSRTIDFNEMIHTALALNLHLPQYDLILADEIQDSSLMIMELYKRCLKPNGFIIGVGDPKQAIFGFAGSRNEGMDIFGNMFGCEQYLLSTNFRCGKNHIALANAIVPDIRAHDNAVDGDVFTLQDVDYETAKPGDMFICRTNAPLVGPCLKLVKIGKKANIKGRDIAGPINTLFKKVEHLTKNEALDKLIDMEGGELRIAEKRKYKQSGLDAINDRYSIARDFLVECNDVKEAKRKLYDIFADDTPGIVFSSIHKAKGLEADNVTILKYNQVRMSRNDMTDWQREQEAHLEYVALTRPKKSITLVIGDKKEEE